MRLFLTIDNYRIGYMMWRTWRDRLRTLINLNINNDYNAFTLTVN